MQREISDAGQTGAPIMARVHASSYISLETWWLGWDSNPRARHYEESARSICPTEINHLPPGVRCSWHDRAQPSTTESRKRHARS